MQEQFGPGHSPPQPEGQHYPVLARSSPSEDHQLVHRVEDPVLEAEFPEPATIRLCKQEGGDPPEGEGEHPTEERREGEDNPSPVARGDEAIHAEDERREGSGGAEVLENQDLAEGF